MKFGLNPKSVKRSFNLAKVVKPQSQDYSVIFNGGHVIFGSSDKRKSVVSYSIMESQDSCADEFYLPMDRSSILDMEMDKCEVHINEKGANLKYTESGKSRSALLKRRSEDSKRPKLQLVYPSPSPVQVNSSILEDILRSVSASALVKETKTEEDMKMNQVFSYPEHSCLVSNARFYATQVIHDSIKFDFSIVSSDVPVVRAFAEKSTENLSLSHDQHKTYVHSSDGSCLALSKVKTNKPSMLIPAFAFPEKSIDIDREEFRATMKWVASTAEGTNRVTVECLDDVLSFKSAGVELATSSCITNGNAIKMDLPINILSMILDYCSDGIISLTNNVAEVPGMVVFRQNLSSGVVVNHFMKPMR